MIFSIFRPSDSRFSNIAQTIHQWKYDLFIFQMMHGSYDSHMSNTNVAPGIHAFTLASQSPSDVLLTCILDSSPCQQWAVTRCTPPFMVSPCPPPSPTRGSASDGEPSRWRRSWPWPCSCTCTKPHPAPPTAKRAVSAETCPPRR